VNSPVRSAFPLIFLSILVSAPHVLAQTAPSTTTQTPNPAAAPPPPLPPDEYKNLSDITVELFYWQQKAHPVMRPGKANVDGDNANLGSGIDLLGKSKAAEGVLITTPAGRANLLEFTYFRTKQSGNETSPIALVLFGQPFSAGDAFGSTTSLQHARVSWSYLTYPDPPGVHKFRFRTLYGIEYTSITARFDAPFDVYATPIQGTRTIIFPSFGIGMEYHFSKHFYFDAKAEGFAWPKKAIQGDGDAKLSYRLFKQLDVVVGAKDFYFKTNPQKDYFLKANMFGPYGGLRWTFK
jgi:hypothetical protein